LRKAKNDMVKFSISTFNFLKKEAK